MFEEYLKTLGAIIVTPMIDDEPLSGFATWGPLKLRYGWDEIEGAARAGFDRWANAATRRAPLPTSERDLADLLRTWREALTGNGEEGSGDLPAPVSAERLVQHLPALAPPKPRRQDHFGLRLRPELQHRLDALLPQLLAAAPAGARVTRSSLAASLIEDGITRLEAKLAGKASS